jgi:hypothetical protein
MDAIEVEMEALRGLALTAPITHTLRLSTACRTRSLDSRHSSTRANPTMMTWKGETSLILVGPDPETVAQVLAVAKP